MLTITDISKTYSNGVRALKNVSLSVPTGLFGLLGPNGAGKSSLMRTIATLQQADSGRIEFAGIDVAKDPESVRRTLGYLPQDFGVYPKISAEDLLDHFAVLKGLTNKTERRLVVEALLNQTNLWSARKRKLGTYSGGMRQRFGIAQALIGNPKLVIVDEPTAGLDPEERNRFLNLLAEIGEQVVVILSTHIVDDVTDLCPRMAMIQQGEVLISGKPIEAIEALRARVWKAKVAKAELEDIKAAHTVLSTRLVAGEPVVHIYAENAPEPRFAAIEPDLEDVYFLKLRQHSAHSKAA